MAEPNGLAAPAEGQIRGIRSLSGDALVFDPVIDEGTEPTEEAEPEPEPEPEKEVPQPRAPKRVFVSGVDGWVGRAMGDHFAPTTKK